MKYRALLLILNIVLFTNRTMSQCVAPALVFHSPVLKSGTNGQVGSIYNFATVLPGVDAHIEIVDLYGGATLNNIDDSAGIGYYDAFQPYVGAGANDTSYLEWKIVFKKAGTSVDTTLGCVAVTGVDVDGDGSALKEFIEAATPGSIGVDPMTNLSVTFDGVRSKAISPVANIPLIDTAHHEAMFQMNFTNINTLSYRNGAITTGGAQVRQTCIFFRPFFQTYTLLANKLLSFTARSYDRSVQLKWSASDETNLKYYTVQRSEDGINWQNIGNKFVLNTMPLSNYLVNDLPPQNSTIYYRILQVAQNGNSSYSPIVSVNRSESDESFSHNTTFTDALRLQIKATSSEQYDISLYSLNGAQVLSSKTLIHPGSNSLLIDASTVQMPGMYLLQIVNSRGEGLYRSKLIRRK